MIIEALRLDTANLSLSEMERVSYITGDERMHAAILRCEDELSSPFTPDEEAELRDALSRAEDEVSDLEDDVSVLTRALEAVSEYLAEGRAITPDQMREAAKLVDVFLVSPGRRARDALVADLDEIDAA